jgi:hypothetical protein
MRLVLASNRCSEAWMGPGRPAVSRVGESRPSSERIAPAGRAVGAGGAARDRRAREPAGGGQPLGDLREVVVAVEEQRLRRPHRGGRAEADPVLGSGRRRRRPGRGERPQSQHLPDLGGRRHEDRVRARGAGGDGPRSFRRVHDRHLDGQGDDQHVNDRGHRHSARPCARRDHRSADRPGTAIAFGRPGGVFRVFEAERDQTASHCDSDDAPVPLPARVKRS